jgi:hypothetical protein
MEAIWKLHEEFGCKVAMVGDTEQIQRWRGRRTRDVLAMMQSTEREKSATEILREELDATHISRVSARSTTTNFSSTAARITV